MNRPVPSFREGAAYKEYNDFGPVAQKKNAPIRILLWLFPQNAHILFLWNGGTHAQEGKSRWRR
jgi:hypothetical protein